MAGKDMKPKFAEFMAMKAEEGEAKSDVKELTGGIGFSVDVLTTGYWPIYTHYTQALQINLPPPASPPPHLHHITHNNTLTLLEIIFHPHWHARPSFFVCSSSFQNSIAITIMPMCPPPPPPQPSSPPTALS